MDLHEIDLQEDDEEILDQQPGLAQPQGTLQNLEGAPKAPVSAYILFIKDLKQNMTQVEAQTLGKNFLQEASKKWNALGEEQKKVYQNSADTMKAVYNDYMKQRG